MSGSDPITAIGNLFTTTIDKIFPDANQAAQAKAAFATLRETNDFQVQLANLQINLADAQSKNWFQSAWRPALAWSCVLTFIYHYLLFTFIVNFYPPLKDIDSVSFTAMMGVLMFLIGARSYDKAQQTDTK
jgi:hypothetical protein